MLFQSLAALAGLCLSGQAFALPEPHNGMVNNSQIQDVGAVYTKEGAQGDRDFLLAVKAKPYCMPLNSVVCSVEICVEATCTFYSKPGCAKGTEAYSFQFTVNGPGDAHTVPMPGNLYASYKCSLNQTDVHNAASASIDTTPHDSTKDTASMK